MQPTKPSPSSRLRYQQSLKLTWLGFDCKIKGTLPMHRKAAKQAVSLSLPFRSLAIYRIDPTQSDNCRHGTNQLSRKLCAQSNTNYVNYVCSQRWLQTVKSLPKRCFSLLLQSCEADKFTHRQRPNGLPSQPPRLLSRLSTRFETWLTRWT